MVENYDKLSEIVLFFSQRFHMEQLVSYGYDFLHEKLALKKSAIYVIENDIFELKSKKGYQNIPPEIIHNPILNRIATLHGRLLINSFGKYFKDNFVDIMEMEIIIPLIVKNELVGLIISDGVTEDSLTSEHIDLIEKANILINNAMAIAKGDIDYKDMSKILDKEIFSLMFVNQSTRVLMSEHDIKKLYLMCIDMIRELTASSITSLGIYDELSDRVIIRGYKDIVSFKEKYVEFELLDGQLPPRKVIYHLKRDKDELKRIFKNLEEFEELEAEYIILIVMERVIGFVTISKAVNNTEYDSGTLEMIESMAASIYISITNALYLRSIQNQSERIRNQLSMLERMNISQKNILSCESVEEMSSLIVGTLEIGFDIEKAMVIFRKEDKYEIVSSIDDNLQGHSIKLNEDFMNNNERELHFHHDGEIISQYFDKETVARLGVTNCFVLAPIKTDNITMTNRCEYAYIVVTKTKNALREEQILLLESLSNAVSPLVKQFIEIDKIKNSYLPNKRKQFLDELKKLLDEKESYGVDFKIFFKRVVNKLFSEPDLSEYQNLNMYNFDNYLFVLSNENIEKSLFDNVIEVSSEGEFFEFIETLE